MYRKIILDKLDKVQDLLPSMEVAIEIERLTHDPSSTVEQIGNVLRNDPALTAKVLKLANSAIFARSKRIVSINQAISTLGFKEFNKITSTITFVNAFKSKYISYQKYWLHSMAVAFMAVKLNDICKASLNPDRLFTGGILHDIGVLILDNYFLDIYKKVYDITVNKRVDLHKVEERVLGITHAEVGAFMLKKWRLPEQVTDIIQFHHKPHLSTVVATDTKLVYLADFIVNNRGYSTGTEGFLRGFYDDIWEDIGLTVEDMPLIVNGLDAELVRARELLKLGGRG